MICLSDMTLLLPHDNFHFVELVLSDLSHFVLYKLNY